MRSRKTLAVGIACHVAVLFAFKHLAFLVREAGALFWIDLSGFRIGMPIGISFFTFPRMSCLLDIYCRTTEVQRIPPAHRAVHRSVPTADYGADGGCFVCVRGGALAWRARGLGSLPTLSRFISGRNIAYGRPAQSSVKL